LGMSVYPQVFELDVFPGEKRVERVKLTNKSNVALPIEVRVVDFTAKDITGEMMFDEFSQDPSFASRKWFNLINPNFILEEGEKRDIVFNISIPENAEPGGHYATMLFEPLLPSLYFKKGQPRAVPVIGVLFLFSVRTLSLEPQEKPALEIVEFSISKQERMLALENITSKLLGSVVQASGVIITKKAPQTFILRIKNNDIYHTKPSGKVLIYNMFDKKVGEAEVLQMTILPGKIRDFPVKVSLKGRERLKWLPAFAYDLFSQNLFVGKYKARLELNATNLTGEGLLAPSGFLFLTFFSLPWRFWILFISFLVLLAFLLIKYRKRMVLALKTLIGR